ncbi:hypothetical protein J6590_047418 [Homalodisca vitripennis]|nr:hypothetical protein J6590_047418 [Homalodisca vitripennis]
MESSVVSQLNRADCSMSSYLFIYTHYLPRGEWNRYNIKSLPEKFQVLIQKEFAHTVGTIADINKTNEHKQTRLQTSTERTHEHIHLRCGRQIATDCTVLYRTLAVANNGPRDG